MNPETPVTERVAAFIGAVFAAATLAFLVYDGACSVRTPPQLHVEVLSVASAGTMYHVQIRVSNTGGQPASGVIVQGELGPEGHAIEEATAIIDYVPGESHADAGLIFTTDPRAHALRVHPLGYSAP